MLQGNKFASRQLRPARGELYATEQEKGAVTHSSRPSHHEIYNKVFAQENVTAWPVNSVLRNFKFWIPSLSNCKRTFNLDYFLSLKWQTEVLRIQNGI